MPWGPRAHRAPASPAAPMGRGTASGRGRGGPPPSPLWWRCAPPRHPLRGCHAPCPGAPSRSPGTPVAPCAPGFYCRHLACRLDPPASIFNRAPALRGRSAVFLPIRARAEPYISGVSSTRQVLPIGTTDKYHRNPRPAYD